MEAECIPVKNLPGTTALFRACAEMRDESGSSLLERCYPTNPFSLSWASNALELSPDHRERLVAELQKQTQRFGAGGAVQANLEALRSGASAVVTGQQVGLFGGPLLTLLKAATAIRKAKDATQATGKPHVPIFWLASEDHDLAEVDKITLLGKTSLEDLSLGLQVDNPVPVGGLDLAAATPGSHKRVSAELDRAAELLGFSPIADSLREFYAEPGATLASAFGKLLTRIFAEYGLIVMDASSRECHALGASTLQAAILKAPKLETALLQRAAELESAGFHAQVLVQREHSLLFLLDAATGARLPLRRDGEDKWRAGQTTLTQAELLEILASEPERISPNALLRPVFQDTLLPTAAYVGGPAEVAYFAQSAVVYEAILGRITPILPRFSATLIEPAIAKVMDAHEIDIAQVFEAKSAENLSLRLGARAMPIEGKRKLAAAGNSLDAELTALTEYMAAMSEDLGRTASVSASKMRYQMNRLRRLAARFESEKEVSIQKHAAAIMLHLFPGGHLQERTIAGVSFLAQDDGTLIEKLVAAAGEPCPGHSVIRL